MRLLVREAMSVRQLVEIVEVWRAQPERLSASVHAQKTGLQEEESVQGSPAAALLAYSEVASHAVH